MKTSEEIHQEIKDLEYEALREKYYKEEEYIGSQSKLDKELNKKWYSEEEIKKVIDENTFYAFEEELFGDEE